ncbi:MAG TPA: hypothetical protein VKR32_13360 [Puia sp.]|nr:hypothetical protein [Puia sp.]
MLLTDDGWRKCTVSNENYFKYHDVIVTAKLTANDLVVLLNSPKIAIKEVKLIWNHHLGEKALCLGDHWERTYGDVGWSKPDFGKKEPWYLTIYDENSTACFGVKTGCNSICSWSLRPATLELSLNTRSGGTGVWLGDRELNLANIVTTCNSEPESTFQTQRRFCRIMCEQSRLPKQPIYGINDWYYAYGNNSPELILKQSRLMSELVSDTGNLPFCVIDAGWAKYAPALPGDCCWQEDFSKANEKFKDIQALASQLKAIGMRPGLWTRPLCAKSTDPKNLLLPKIRGRENPLNPILDPTIPENIERMKNNFVTYKLWGFEMVKHDFSTFDITGKWGFEKKDQITEEGWRFSDNSKTTAEVINHLYRSIREAAGEMYLIGCNTLSHLSAGKFELNRIGDDTSGKEWSRTRKMGVNCLAFRICQHRSFYFTDGDCVGLTTQVPWEKNKQWMQLLAESSTPLFISAQPDALKLPQKSFIKDCFARAAKVQPIGEPLDWMQDNLPNKWRLNNREVDFDWN